MDVPLILKLDAHANPIAWIDAERAAYYYAKDLVVWSMGEYDYTLHGGISSLTGRQSTLTLNTIVAVRSEVSEKTTLRQRVPSLENRLLFKRDRNMCAYCGKVFLPSDLTRDHIKPTSKGGKNIWTNVVTACRGCNRFKDDNEPHEVGLQLLYVPYVPSRAEALILSNRNILADQMEFLLKHVPEHSRVHKQ
jgi:5-methylcytosine-specific restriction endonuclease McrA